MSRKEYLVWGNNLWRDCSISVKLVHIRWFPLVFNEIVMWCSYDLLTFKFSRRWRVDCERTTDYRSRISCLNLTSLFHFSTLSLTWYVFEFENRECQHKTSCNNYGLWYSRFQKKTGNENFPNVNLVLSINCLLDQYLSNNF
jgi:hypothetical protein